MGLVKPIHRVLYQLSVGELLTKCGIFCSALPVTRPMAMGSECDIVKLVIW